jgi:zinc protease
MLIDVPITTRTLANGLDVIVHEDRHAPLVAVCVWYHVGSKNETPGRTGFAHLFEHLMFEGAAHQPRGYFEPLQEVGGALNGSTSADRTNYWEVVPREAAALALWMEADRMGWMLPALSADRFETQRDVVLNERRQNYENRPYGVAQFALSAALFPSNHPYHWPTIGDPEDLRAATVDDARAFLSEFYHPANASLAIAGDIATADAMDLVEELFGGIPTGPAVTRPTAEPPRARARRLVLEDDVELPRVYLAWPSPALFAAGDAELDLLGDTLANSRTSHLYRRLIHERRVATELVASQTSRELGGMFQIVATAAPGRTLAEIETAVTDVLGAVGADGPSEAELSRGKTQAEAAFVYRLQTLGGFGGKVDQLNAYNVYRGNPDGFADDLARYLLATGDSVREAASRWLVPDRALALSVVPRGRPDLALPESEPVETA